MPSILTTLRFSVSALLLTAALTAHARIRIAVLNFELNDLTLLPHTPAERARTASLRPLLAAALSRKGFDLVPVAADAERRAQAGAGYLFDHPDSAAALARNVGADYIVIGRLHKPSFLFAYIIARLATSRENSPTREFLTEIKGGDSRLTEKGIAVLADDIAKALSR